MIYINTGYTVSVSETVIWSVLSIMDTILAQSFLMPCEKVYNILKFSSQKD